METKQLTSRELLESFKQRFE